MIVTITKDVKIVLHIWPITPWGRGGQQRWTNHLNSNLEYSREAVGASCYCLTFSSNTNSFIQTHCEQCSLTATKPRFGFLNESEKNQQFLYLCMALQTRSNWEQFQQGRDPDCKRGGGGGDGGRKRMDVLPAILFAARREKKWATIDANAEKIRGFACGCMTNTGGRHRIWNIHWCRVRSKFNHVLQVFLWDRHTVNVTNNKQIWPIWGNHTLVNL